MRDDGVMGHVRSTGGTEHWATTLRSAANDLVADEPASGGGAGAGFTPFALLLSGLAACTNITLRMYADRKGWPLASVDVECTLHRDDGDGDGDGDAPADRIERGLTLTGQLDDDQRARLADIAERTPVTLVVKRGTPIVTTLK